MEAPVPVASLAGAHSFLPSGVPRLCGERSCFRFLACSWQEERPSSEKKKMGARPPCRELRASHVISAPCAGS